VNALAMMADWVVDGFPEAKKTDGERYDDAAHRLLQAARTVQQAFAGQYWDGARPETVALGELRAAANEFEAALQCFDPMAPRS
jgi:hypothetical protein